jgi:hypothetical protein
MVCFSSGLEAMLNMTSSSSHNQALHLTAQSLRSFAASELGRYALRRVKNEETN